MARSPRKNLALHERRRYSGQSRTTFLARAELLTIPIRPIDERGASRPVQTNVLDAVYAKKQDTSRSGADRNAHRRTGRRRPVLHGIGHFRRMIDSEKLVGDVAGSNRPICSTMRRPAKFDASSQRSVL